MKKEETEEEENKQKAKADKEDNYFKKEETIKDV